MDRYELNELSKAEPDNLVRKYGIAVIKAIELRLVSVIFVNHQTQYFRHARTIPR